MCSFGLWLMLALMVAVAASDEGKYPTCTMFLNVSKPLTSSELFPRSYKLLITLSCIEPATPN